ncbi:mediator of RNA polymerase II transcription subunit 8 [Elasticomyces elasticus]|nr:mediator of RNA polymerase II transcription subunit 8 [Elasticomyces elasticus]
MLVNNLENLQKTLGIHATTLEPLHAYPLPDYPGHTQSALLEQLLRKKVQPSVGDWIADGEAKGLALTTGGTYNDHNTHQPPVDSLSEADIADLWTFAGPTNNQIVSAMIFDDAFADPFTLAERELGIENVVTGLRRQLVEPESDDEERENAGDDKMQDVQTKNDDGGRDKEKKEMQSVDENKPMMAFEDVYRFISAGVEPRTGQGGVRR